MASITGFTAARMLEIENKAVFGGAVVGDNLILVTKDGTEINAGNVRGPEGPVGVPNLPEVANDGVAYARQYGLWVPVKALLAPVSQIFIASGTWTKPADAKLVIVKLWGGGGGGARGVTATYQGGGGGGGQFAWAIFEADDLGATESIVIGAGGAPYTGNGYNTPAGAGGSTYFGTHLVALGGQGGIGALSSGANGTGGVGGGVLGVNAGAQHQSGLYSAIGPYCGEFAGGTGGNGSNPNGQTAASSMFGAGGGGGAGTTAGGPGGQGNKSALENTTGNAAAGSGAAGTSRSGSGRGGNGGNGGGGAGGAGGNGGVPGGGGGAANNDGASIPGTGARGEAIIITIF